MTRGRGLCRSPPPPTPWGGRGRSIDGQAGPLLSHHRPRLARYFSERVHLSWVMYGPPRPPGSRPCCRPFLLAGPWEGGSTVHGTGTARPSFIAHSAPGAALAGSFRPPANLSLACATPVVVLALEVRGQGVQKGRGACSRSHGEGAVGPGSQGGQAPEPRVLTAAPPCPLGSCHVCNRRLAGLAFARPGPLCLPRLPAQRRRSGSTR